MKEKILAILDTTHIGVFLFIIFIANILDATLTIIWLNAGIATEANPIMDYLLGFGELWFFTVKISTVALACLILWALRDFKLAKLVAIICFAVYCAIIIFHIVGAHNAGLSLSL